MENSKRVSDSTAVVTEPVHRGVSWPAVFAGVVIAFMVMAILNMLAVGVGINSIDLTGTGNPFEGLGAGLGWSMVIINLIAYALGGYIAGRVATTYRRSSGMLHGLLAWAIMVLASASLLTTAAGAVLGSIGSVVGSGFSLAAQGVGALAPAVSESLGDAAADLDLSASNIRSQLSDLLLETTGETDDTPAALAGIQVQQLVRDAFSGGEEMFSPENRAAVIELLADETDLTAAQAEEVVASWEESYVAAQERLEELQAQLTEAAEQAQRALTRTMLWAAVALIVAAAVSAWAGAAGASARREIRTVHVVR